MLYRPASTLWTRLTRVRLSRSSLQPLLATTLRSASTRLLSSPTRSMFHRAVSSHNARADQQSLEKRIFPSSSEQPSSASPSQSSAKSSFSNPSFKPPSQIRPLHNAPSSFSNGVSRRTPQVAQGVKRTATGAVKALCGSSQNAFAEAKQRHGLKIPPSQQSIDLTIDENDFDSDIDLEVDEPKNVPRPTVSYPRLPAQQPKIIPYPTIKQASFHSQASVNARPAVAEDPASSQPYPWSSSPIEHITHKPIPPSLPQQTADPVQPKDEPLQQPQRAPKRRTLPWNKQSSTVPELDNRIDHSAMTGRQSTELTEHSPLPPKTPGAFPWEATASAMKERQKLHREANNSKKPTKVGEPMDDAKEKTKPMQQSTKVSAPCLSMEQRRVLELVTERSESVFFTGSAGTGKSVLLREIISVLRKMYAKETDRIAVTASTGLAACNVGGVTLHSFAGIGLGKEDVETLLKKIRRNQKAKHRWMRTKVLVVDEVSMVDGELFDKLEEIGRRLRNNGRPFGGIQLVITGDFFQLPPVPDYGRSEARFCFDAKTWSSVITHTIGLHHVFRQRDSTFADMLNEMRLGNLSAKTVTAFRSLDRPLQGQGPTTELFPRRGEVEMANTGRMNRLAGEVMRFEARDGGTIVDKAARDKLLQNCMAPAFLELKKGAQVMLIKNIDETLVNGSLGQVIAFMDERMFDSYNEAPAKFAASKGSDQEEDLVGADIEGNSAFRDKWSLLGATSLKWPVVRFQLADGTTRDLLCQRESWKVELPNGEVQASRAQIPLILAWALSIHKAQGQTLERVKVDLTRVFEKGQAYVALSRATTMTGLQVIGFDPAKVLAHPKVRNFYASLSRAEHAAGKKSVV